VSGMYAMQRANGDWFGLDDGGRLRVPVFYSSGAAMQARARNFQMLLFKPVVLDEIALTDLAPTETAGAAGFWLVNDASMKLKHARPLEHAELALLVHDVMQHAQSTAAEVRR
jgi:hypothetical protein